MSLRQIQIVTPEQVSLRQKVAGLGSRSTAHLLDWLIIGISAFALVAGAGLLIAVLPPSISTVIETYADAGALLALFFLLWGYFMLFEFFAAGRTPGKMLVGIRVVQDNGQSITFLASAVRNLIRLMDFLPVLYLLGILMIFFHPKHKRVGDLAAGTVVVYQSKYGRKKKKSPLEQEIERRLIAHPVSLELDEWTKKKIGSREWKLIETFIKRRPSLTGKEKQELTRQVAGVLFPLVGLEGNMQSLEEVENHLFALYMLLKNDWQYNA